MQRRKFLLALGFTIAYAAFLSVGLACLLKLFGIFLAAAMFEKSILGEYPRLIPFCMIVGLFALISLVVLFVLNLKAAKKFEFTKGIWWMEMVSAAVLSFLLIMPWGMLFEYLQKVF